MSVWVTGIGVVSSAGWGMEATWSAVVAGRSAIRVVDRFPTYSAATRICGAVPGTETIAPSAPVLSLRFALAAAEEALRDAGLESVDLLVCGNQGERRIASAREECLLMSPSELAAAVAHQAGAPRSIAINGACASGGLAIGSAFQLLRAGSASVALAGASDCMLRDFDFFQLCSLYVMSTRECDPAEACCPFDARRDGFVLSEGAGFLVLEREEHARARGVGPRAILAGFGSSQSAYHIVTSPPDAEGPRLAVVRAMQDARIAPGDVQYVNAHGTGTPDNDWCETLALRRAFGVEADSLAISSTKSSLGHGMAAAGAIEAAICVRVLETGVVPPTINLRQPDPRCDLDYVREGARTLGVDNVLSNSFGFGGLNSSLMFSRR